MRRGAGLHYKFVQFAHTMSATAHLAEVIDRSCLHLALIACVTGLVHGYILRLRCED